MHDLAIKPAFTQNRAGERSFYRYVTQKTPFEAILCGSHAAGVFRQKDVRQTERE